MLGAMASSRGQTRDVIEQTNTALTEKQFDRTQVRKSILHLSNIYTSSTSSLAHRTYCSLPSCQLVQLTQRCAYTTLSIRNVDARKERGHLTFSLILFLQYLHLTVCLMTESLEAHPYTSATVYSAIPMPMKLKTLLTKVLKRCQGKRRSIQFVNQNRHPSRR